MIQGEIIESEAGEMLFFIAVFLATIGVFGVLHTPVFGLFDTTVLQSVVYLTSGGILLRSLFNLEKDRFIRLFALFYGALAVMGFLLPHDALLGIFSFKGSNNFLHAFFALIFLFIWQVQNRRTIFTS